MKHALQLIAKLGAAGIQLWLDEEGQLRFKAPKGALTPELKEALVAAKAAVIEVLKSSHHEEPDEIPLLPRDGRPLPLSFAQQRLWFLDRLDPGNASYHISAALKISGPLHIDTLRQAFQDIVNRHESLRTTFLFEEGEVGQVIKEPFDWPLSENYDLSALNPGEQKQRLNEIAEDESLRSFDLTDGTDTPYRRIRLLRTRLARLTPENSATPVHVLFITMHHVIADGWSIGILVNELSALYQAHLKGEPSPLPPLVIQYADFSSWQRQWLQSAKVQQQINYWQKQLDNVTVLELATEFPRPAVMRNVGANVRFQLGKELSQQLQQYAQQQGKTLFMVLMAAFQVLLARYTGQEDICVGTPVANRTRREIEPLIGCFINTLAIRGCVDSNQTFSQFLDGLAQTTLDAFNNQEVPFELLVDKLGTPRDQSFTPIFQVLFSLENSALNYNLHLQDLHIERLPLNSHTAKYDLQLHMIESEQISGEIEFNTDLFSAKTMQRLSRHLETLLAGIIEQPDTPIQHLPLITPNDRRRLLGTAAGSWNDTAKNYGDIKALHTLFESQVEKTPDAPAIRYRDRVLSYRELNQSANRLARYLRELGVGPDTLVGVCMERAPEMSVALFAIHKAGGAYVPFDPNFPAERLAYMVEDTAITVLLSQSHLVGRVPVGEHIHVLRLDQPDQPWDRLDADNLDVIQSPEHLFNVIYTSGSTGKPKGVMVPQGGIINRLIWMQEEYLLTSADRVLQKTPYSFDVSVWELFWPFLFGAELVYAKPEGHKDPDYLRDLIIEERITTLHFVPSMLGIFLQTDSIERCSHLRLVFCSGEALPVDFERRFFQRLGFAGLHNLYGPTEASIDVSYYPCRADSPYSSVPIGKPVANTQLHVLDRVLQPVPVGVVGELYLGGVQLARGYLNRPDLTAAAFIDNPYYQPGAPDSHPSPRLYKTGDLARFKPDGNIEYMGRIDHQVKIRGFRIELGEIETVLAKHPGVRDVAVATYESSPGNKMLVAYIVQPEASRHHVLNSADLRDHVKAELPEYMVPAAFVVLDNLPLSANGKLNRKALPAPQLESLSSAVYVAPRDATEQLLAEIWASTLNVDQVGVHDNFFEIGGHSLLAAKLVVKLRQAFDVDVPLRALFDNPTVEALAKRIDERSANHRATRHAPIVPLDRNQPLQMSLAQERLWIIEQLAPGNTAYNMPAAWHLHGELDPERLGQAFTRLIERHESLRTCFSTDSQGLGLQVILPASAMPLRLEEVPAGPPRQILQQYLDEEANTPFNLSTGPLLRARLLRLGQAEYGLILNMHHIVSDGWSVNILQKELTALYDAILAGTEAELPPLAVQYADFAAWQRQYLDEDLQQTNLNYWKETLAGAPALLQLPLDRPRPAQQTFNGATHGFHLDADTTQHLRQFSTNHSTTLYTTLLSAYALLLGRYASQNDVCIGTPVAGRPDPALENVIGYFINTVVIRANLQGNPSVTELVTRIKDSTLGALAHQDVPIEKVLDALTIERNISYPPVAQVGFNFINAPMATQASHLGEARVEYIESNKVVAKYDLTLIFIETAQGLEATAEYNRDLFDAETIATMMSRYQRLLTEMSADADKAIDTISLLSEAELFAAAGVSHNDYEQVLPLTPIQRDLYLNARVFPDTLSNNLGYHVIFDSMIDPELWRQACQTIADRQSTLRTDIVDTRLKVGDVAYQCVARPRPVELQIIDIRNQNPSEKQVRQTITQQIYTPLHFGKGGLVRYALILVNDQRCVAVTVMHHTLADGVTLAMHGQVTLATYRHLSGEDAENTAIPLTDTFAEFSQVARRDADTTATLDFWRAKLQSVEALQFPSSTPGSQRVYRSHRFTAEQWASIKAYCRKQRITPALYMKCLYGLLINVYCRPESDFAIAEFNAGRDRQTMLSTGCFFQQTPFVFPQALLNGQATFAELLAHARGFQKEAKDKQAISIRAQRQMQPQGGLQFMYNYYHFFPATELIHGKPVHHQEYPPLVENTVQFVAKEMGDEAQVDLLFEPSRFNDYRLLDRLVAVSEQLVTGKERLADLVYVTPAEYQQQVETWNQTQVDLPAVSSVQALIEAQVQRSPEAIAVSADDERMTYADLNARANRLAHHLRQLGVGSDVRVGICLHRSAEFMVALLAVIKAGGAYIPMDASYPSERLSYMLKDGHAPILISRSEIASQLDSYQGKILNLDDAGLHTSLVGLPESNPVNRSESDDLLYIIYTSGSTGRPKGATVMHRGEINLLNWYTREFGFNGDTRCLVISALGFDLTQKNLLAPLVSGGTVVLPRLEHYDSEAVADIIDTQGVTLMNCAPSAFYALTEDQSDLRKLRNLQTLIMGGEPIRVERLRRWLDSPFCRCSIVNNYGPTECTDIAAFHRLEDPLQYVNKPVPIGRPNDNVQLYVLNDLNQLLPVGLAGELCIAGEGVGRGYLNHDELNLAKFIANPFGDGQLYRSGDLVRYREDGKLEFIGRKDFQVKLNGLRIELGEIEYALREQEEVNDALATVKEGRLIAYVTCANPAQLAVDQLKQVLRRYLPVYMVPSLILALAQWPLTPNGKIDRHALPGTSDDNARLVEYVAPRNDIEQKLADILCHVLGMAQVGVHDDFFDIGGHSLAASRAIVQIREVFHIEIPLHILFEKTTIESLAEYISVTQWAVNSQAGSNAESGPREEGLL